MPVFMEKRFIRRWEKVEIGRTRPPGNWPASLVGPHTHRGPPVRGPPRPRHPKVSTRKTEGHSESTRVLRARPTARRKLFKRGPTAPTCSTGSST